MGCLRPEIWLSPRRIHSRLRQAQIWHQSSSPAEHSVNPNLASMSFWVQWGKEPFDISTPCLLKLFCTKVLQQAKADHHDTMLRHQYNYEISLSIGCFSNSCLKIRWSPAMISFLPWFVLICSCKGGMIAVSQDLFSVMTSYDYLPFYDHDIISR